MASPARDGCGGIRKCHGMVDGSGVDDDSRDEESKGDEVLEKSLEAVVLDEEELDWDRLPG